MINKVFEALAEVDYYKDLAKKRLLDCMTDFFAYVPNEEILPLKEPCKVETWNKGYDFTVTGFKKRSDGCIMMCGTYCDKDDTEFFSYIWGYNSIQKITQSIKQSFF